MDQARLTDSGALPQRRFLDPTEPPRLDPNGFHDVHQPGISTGDVLSLRTVLITAPPWTGKSFVARAIEGWLRMQPQSSQPPNGFGSYFHLTNFERHRVDLGQVPAWWQAWRDSDARGCWMIDAVDEDARFGSGGTYRALDELEMLTAEQRSRFHLLMFSRENEVPPRTLKRLHEIYGDWQEDAGTGLRRLRLAPLDARSAMEHVGGPDEFARVCSLIRQNRLQSIAAYPSVLDRLRRYPPEAQVKDVDVWRKVLYELLREQRTEDPLREDGVPLDLQLRAAAWLAVTLTFGDYNEIDDGFGNSAFPSLDRLIPSDHAEPRTLNQAARAALKSSIFQRTTAGYRFAQHHVQEWMAAFGLAPLRLTQIRPLLTDNTGRLAKQHNSVAGLSVKTTEHEQVRQWIIRESGGIPPRSDAAPLTLDEAVAALQRLQTIARATPWGLSTWELQNLSWLDLPGMGAILVSHLSDQTLSRNERDLLIDAAREIQAREVVPAALDLVRDSLAVDRLRASAAFLVLDLGTAEQQLELGRIIVNLEPSTAEQRGMKADVIRWLFDRKLWTFNEAVRHAPPPDSRTSVLHSVLEDAMTVPDAREFFRLLDINRFLIEQSEINRTNRTYHAGRLLLRAVGLITSQPEPSESDYDLLIPVALSLGRDQWRGMERPELNAYFRRDASARRKLFSVGMAQPDDASKNRNAPWRWILLPEDVLWLLELAERYGEARPWLWDQVVRLAIQASVEPGARTEVRDRVEARVKGLWDRHEAAQRQAEEAFVKYQREDAAYRRERDANTFGLEALVRETLSWPESSLHEKMVQLSWIALTKPAFRPQNVIGSWDQVPRELREQVLDLCQQALVECTPTEIPTGNSYPAGVVYEPFCFAQVLAERPGRYTLDAEQVRKWLPASLVFYEDVGGGVIERCVAADPTATEASLVAEVTRRLSAAAGGPYFVEQLPPEVWSPSFAAQLARLVDEERGTIDGQSLLLRVLLKKTPELAVPRLQNWLRRSDPQTIPPNSRRYAALNLLLATDPQLAWDSLVAEVSASGKNAFVRLTSLADRHAAPRSALESWDTEMLECLAGLLFQCFPKGDDPVQQYGEWRQVTAEDQYRDLRDRLPQLLLSRGTPQASAALERLAASHASVAAWLAHVKGRQSATEFLQQLQPASFNGAPGTVPVDEIVKLLDSGSYRLIRTSADLQSVLLEEIDAITTDARLHVALLYLPRKGRQKNAKTKLPPTLHEDALQAYFQCRLSDRLIGRVLGRATNVMFMNREPLTAKDQRLDIKVEAPTLDGGRATVVIELKWSHHPDVSRSLAKQLGQEYLVGGGVDRGIYLVGWSGAGVWKDGRHPAPPNMVSPIAWQEALLRQASAFAAEQGVEIAVRVVDLSWPSSRTARPGHRQSRRTARSVSRGKPATNRSHTLGQRKHSKKRPRKGKD
jgi:hypothetical protein